jgi:hypothetical protein
VLTNIRLGWKGLRGKTLQLIMNIRILGTLNVS